MDQNRLKQIFNDDAGQTAMSDNNGNDNFLGIDPNDTDITALNTEFGNEQSGSDAGIDEDVEDEFTETFGDNFRVGDVYQPDDLNWMTPTKFEDDDMEDKKKKSSGIPSQTFSGGRPRSIRACAES